MAVLLVALAPTARADQAPPCRERADILRLAHPLARVAKKLNAGEPITIVAIGSSSTQGAGASSPRASYPSRLAEELGRQFPGNSFKMLNRGVGGEEIADMLKRFDSAVVAAKPDLVLWQLGTNSVIRDHMIDDHGRAIRAGISKIRATGADIVLIDPQFAPKVIVKPDAQRMVDLISATAKLENVDLFRRFDVMKAWHEQDKLSFETFVHPDGLHLNDWSYACMAKGLGVAIAEAVKRPVISATAMPAAAGALAHGDW
ncbi:MAG: SGNH/GDSL hydrolase family protein [Pseudolabrys sp.]